MTDALLRRQRRLRQSSDEFWSQLQTVWQHTPLPRGAGRMSPTWEVFSERFDRCFRRLSVYVSRRVNDRESLERIVTDVLAGNLDLFIAQYSEVEESRRLKASADRLLALGASPRPGADTPSSGVEYNVYAAQSDERG